MTKERRGSRRPERAATRDMVVLSPPGRISASHRERSFGVRTSMNVKDVAEKLGKLEASRSSWMCSLKKEDGGEDIIAVRQGNVFGCSFHPELTADARIHAWWLGEVVKAAGMRQEFELADRTRP